MEKPTLSTDTLSGALTELRALNQTLHPVLIPLNPDEVRELDKLGNISYSFVVKALEFAVQYPALVPNYQDMQYIQSVYQQFTLLRQMSAITEQLHNNTRTTRMKIGSVVKLFAKEVYDISKLAAKQNIPGAKEAELELGELYARGKKQDNEGELINVKE